MMINFPINTIYPQDALPVTINGLPKPPGILWYARSINSLGQTFHSCPFTECVKTSILSYGVEPYLPNYL